MPNNITLAKTYVPILDETYRLGSLSAILDSNESIVKLGTNGKDILISKMDLQGLGETTRGGNYVDGEVTLSWETITPDYDRNRMFNIDSQDNVETAGLAYGALAGEFIREKVVPELDAYRFATYASESGIGAATPASLADTAATLAALRAAQTSMDELEIPAAGRILFITPSLYKPLKDMDTTKSREILGEFAAIVQVPQTRFYTKVTLKDGKTAGQEAGGYAKAVDGKDINFLIVHPSAVVQTLKHVAPKIVTPEENQSGDNYKFGYRAYGIADVLERKRKAIYVHNKA